MIKKICLGVIRIKIGGLQGKLWRFREVGLGSNQLLKILLIKKFSNDSDFCFWEQAGLATQRDVVQVEFGAKFVMRLGFVRLSLRLSLLLLSLRFRL